MRIAIVNDDSVAMEVLRRAIGTSDHTIAWIARDGAEAVRKAASDPADVVLMDLIMPEMDGVEATRRIMQESPCAILVVTGDVTRNTSKVFAALGAGAVDVVATPKLGDDGGVASTRALMAKIKLVGQVGIPRSSVRATGRAASGPALTGLVVIGASAGGPPAVAHVLRDLTMELPVSVLVVQHVDAEFVDSMADWFDSQASFTVTVAREGDVPSAGHVYISAGDVHLVMRQDGRLGYESEPREALYRPSADVMFESVAKHWKGVVVGVVLSGMGRDGAIGLQKLKAAGARTVAQDEKTSAVYGMPKAAKEADAATDVLALDRIGPFLNDLLRRADRTSGQQASISSPSSNVVVR